MKEVKCKVCDHPFLLTETFCPTCGFERHVLPAQVSKEVEEYEKKRVEKYKGRWEQEQKKEEEIKKLNSAVQTAKDKSVVDKQELEKLRTNLEEVTHQTSAIVKEKERELSHLQEEYAATKAAKESMEKQLRHEQNTHNRTKQLVKELQEKIERLSIVKQPTTIDKPKQTQPSTPRTVIGKVLFTSGGRTESVELYSGLCRVTAPLWANIEGELFEINGSRGMYRLLDLKGNMCDHHGRHIPPQGTTTRNNDVFTSGNITIRLMLPEIDLDSLY
ncbi:MAG: hypothetical protein IJX21_04630 [Alistipes sp.]|nr:hypothetical protein [Alistipes sp.]